MTVRRAAAAVAALAAACAPGAAAADVTRAELERLATEARTDRAARERLLAVDSVDGHPVDLRRALAGASGDELAARVAALVVRDAATAQSPPERLDHEQFLEGVAAAKAARG